MSGSGSGAATAVAAPARVLTAEETKIVDDFAASSGIQKNNLLPNDGFITTTPYNTPGYNDFFKSFIQSTGDMNENLKMINRFNTLFTTNPAIPDIVKKSLSVRNRKRELLIKAYYLNNPGALRLDKVVCCIIRGGPGNDGFGLYVHNSSNGLLGFPKGDIEYFLTDPDDIGTVDRETPGMGALRELLEETGFEPKGSVDFRVYPHTFTLEYSGDVLNIVNSRALVEGDVFYLVLFTNTNAVLKPDVPASAALENIDLKLWNKQSTRQTADLFNKISQKTFQYSGNKPMRPENEAVVYMGGKRRKSYRKKTRKNKYSNRKTKRRAHRKH